MAGNAKLWVVFAEADMNDFVVGKQCDALVTAALAAGQANPFPSAMQDIALEIRVKIEANPTNRVSLTPYSIPPELHNDAGWIILERLQTRLPGLALTEEQKEQIKRSWEHLNRIADGRDVVSIPTDPMEPAEVQLGAPLQVTTSSVRTVTQSTMRGI
jgi:hypothetical protein